MACVQVFDEECDEPCSWWADATVETLQVCQDRKHKYKCYGEEVCSEGRYKCRQTHIYDCPINCDEYVGYVDQDTKMVCQNRDPSHQDFGDCLEIPCTKSEYPITDTEYVGASICYQSHNNCMQICGVGSPTPNDTTVCQDTVDFMCNNDLHCPAPNRQRCKPIKQVMNLGDLVEAGRQPGRPLMRAETSKHLH